LVKKKPGCARSVRRKKMDDWVYLGDGVYVTWESGMLKLVTGSHLTPDNTIYLEPEVLENLIRFARKEKKYG